MEKIGNLDNLGISIQNALVSPNTISSSYANTVSENTQNNIMGSLVKWENEDKKEIVWMLTDKLHEGVVIHSDNLMRVGTTTNLKDYILKPFIGTVNIVSAAKE
jgi:hypothetical protein